MINSLSKVSRGELVNANEKQNPNKSEQFSLEDKQETQNGKYVVPRRETQLSAADSLHIKFR